MPDKIRIGSITDLGNGVRINLLRSDNVPTPETFLSKSELEKFASFKIEKRRRDWLGGRYAAKTLLKEALYLQIPLSDIEIAYDLSGRPVWVYGKVQRLLSITHSGPFCAAACGAAGTVFLGIDLEKAEPRANAWYQDYFHKEELSKQVTGSRSQVTGNEIQPAAGQFPVPWHLSPDTCHLATCLWTQKEALLKALGLGLKADLLDVNLAEDAPKFSKAAMKRYEELGSPPFSLATFAPEPGWFISIASARQ
ncbi:MAG: 4'-phosphopantetheinyl transferase superfamily protein [Elusimicrobiota bacterium]